MTKVKYPSSNTVSSTIKNAIIDTNSALNKAKNSCVFGSIPSGFEHTNYLMNLANKVESFKNRATNIYNASVDTDKYYSDMIDSLGSLRENIDANVMDARERLIK